MTAIPFTISCGTQRQGTYLLFIRLSEPVHLVFGKFLKGKPLFLPAGNYLYLGSALGQSGNGFPLARRLLRHASRTAEKKPHGIRKRMLKLLQENDLAPESALKPLRKKLHWHIDYLLDNPRSAIVHILIIRSPDRLEPVLARYLEAFPETSVPAVRLGAQDTRNSTHLLCCSDPDGLLERLRRDLPDITGLSGFHSC